MTISRKGADKLRFILGVWSRALAKQIERHSAPNTFGVVELATEFNLCKADGYRLGHSRIPDLREWLNTDPRVRDLGPFELTYSRGRFAVAYAAPKVVSIRFAPGAREALLREPADPMEFVDICVNCHNNRHDSCDWSGCECPHDKAALQRLANKRRDEEEGKGNA